MDTRTRAEHPDTQLSAIIRRIASKDTRAFARLHESLSGPVARHLATLLTEPRDVRAVTSATFYEVWWLAAMHDADGLDVAAWVRAISVRRARDRRSHSGQPAGSDPVTMTMTMAVTMAVDAAISLEVAALVAQGSRRKSAAEGGGVEPQFLRGTG